MSDKKVPVEAPPSYQDATGSSSSSRPSGPNQTASATSAHLADPHGIDAATRRSMEDEQRPLPKGWIRTYDPQSHHQFFVDTRQDPPRSIWMHPYDDEEYLRTLSSAERERIEHEKSGRGKQPSHAEIMASHTDESEDEHAGGSAAARNAELPPRPDKGKGKKGFGRSLKDKLTGTTHEQREQERRQRAEEERRAYEQHRKTRQAMSRAIETGQPQLVGKDRNGKDVYVEPPMQAGPAGFGYNAKDLGYNPYNQGPYAPPNARYPRPYGPYGRPYYGGGYGGYGGGYGLPLALGGGLLGGMLIGDAMGGGFL